MTTFDETARISLRWKPLFEANKKLVEGDLVRRTGDTRGSTFRLWVAVSTVSGGQAVLTMSKLVQALSLELEFDIDEC